MLPADVAQGHPTWNPLFTPASDTIFRIVLVLVLVGVAGAIALALTYVRSPLFTGQNEPISQPIQFDHRHHVGDDGIDCGLCHSTADRAASAGYPPTETCLGCHAQIWSNSPLIAKLWQSAMTGRALEWKRVHQLPDHVYFNHSIHVNKGLACETCHGRVDQMAEIMRVRPFTMAWCLDCHREPAKQITRASAEIHTRTSCTTCHR
jgi:hypothetical protein